MTTATNHPTPELLSESALAEIEARAEAASDGPWKVYKTPYTLTELGRKEGFKEDRKSVVNAIGQTWDDPQLKGPMAIVTTTHGPYYDPQHAVKIEDEDAEFIAHARTDIPALCATVRAAWAQKFVAEDLLHVATESLRKSESTNTALRDQLTQADETNRLAGMQIVELEFRLAQVEKERARNLCGDVTHCDTCADAKDFRL